MLTTSAVLAPPGVGRSTGIRASGGSGRSSVSVAATVGRSALIRADGPSAGSVTGWSPVASASLRPYSTP